MNFDMDFKFDVLYSPDQSLKEDGAKDTRMTFKLINKNKLTTPKFPGKKSVIVRVRSGI